MHAFVADASTSRSVDVALLAPALAAPLARLNMPLMVRCTSTGYDVTQAGLPWPRGGTGLRVAARRCARAPAAGGCAVRAAAAALRAVRARCRTDPRMGACDRCRSSCTQDDARAPSTGWRPDALPPQQQQPPISSTWAMHAGQVWRLCRRHTCHSTAQGWPEAQ